MCVRLAGFGRADGNGLSKLRDQRHGEGRGVVGFGAAVPPRERAEAAEIHVGQAVVRHCCELPDEAAQDRRGIGEHALQRIDAAGEGGAGAVFSLSAAWRARGEIADEIEGRVFAENGDGGAAPCGLRRGRRRGFGVWLDPAQDGETAGAVGRGLAIMGGAGPGFDLGLLPCSGWLCGGVGARGETEGGYGQARD